MKSFNPTPEITLHAKGLTLRRRDVDIQLEWSHLLEIRVRTTSAGPFAPDYFIVLVTEEDQEAWIWTQGTDPAFDAEAMFDRFTDPKAVQARLEKHRQVLAAVNARVKRHKRRMRLQILLLVYVGVALGLLAAWTKKHW